MYFGEKERDVLLSNLPGLMLVSILALLTVSKNSKSTLFTFDINLKTWRGYMRGNHHRENGRRCSQAPNISYSLSSKSHIRWAEIQSLCSSTLLPHRASTMAVVVSQTIPFSMASLDLSNPSRWNNLLPLIRPSLRTVQTAKGQTILVDTAHASSHHVRIAVVGVLGNFSSKILSDRHISAVVTSQRGAGLLTAKDIAHAIENAGHHDVPGVVVVRSGKQRRIEVEGHEVLEVEVDGDLEMDHVLHLLGTVSESCRSSFHQTAELLKLFVKSASTAHSTFHTEKADGNPAIVHAEGHAGFEKARHAVERDLKHVMRAHAAQQGFFTYSVHYSDVNGLSRLENYILGLEIANFLGKQRPEDTNKLLY